MIRSSEVTTDTSAYDQLQALLQAGSSLGPGYKFEHFCIESIGMEVDRLKFSNSGMVNLDIRQATNRHEDFGNHIIVDLFTVHPALMLDVQHSDGYRSAARNSSWHITVDGKMNYAMLDFDSIDHGPITEETRKNHLELVLGKFTVPDTIPRPYYLK